MLSRLRSSIAVTEFSLSSVGAKSFSLSCTKPVSCLATVDVAASNSTISCRRAANTCSRSLALRMSRLTC